MATMERMDRFEVLMAEFPSFSDGLPEPSEDVYEKLLNTRGRKAMVGFVANLLAAKLDADVVLYNGLLDAKSAIRFIQSLNRRQTRKNVFFILVTSGGEAGAAYRIARVLQTKYKRFRS